MDAASTGRKSKGRPKRKEPLKMVYFTESTFNMWSKMKKEFSSHNQPMSSDEFAKLLLNRVGAGCKMELNSCFGGERIDKEHCYGKVEHTQQLCCQDSGSATSKDIRKVLQKRDMSFGSFDPPGFMIESTPSLPKRQRRQQLDFSSIEAEDAVTENPLSAATAGNTTTTFESSFSRLKTFNSSIGIIEGDPFSDDSDTETNSVYSYEGSTDSSSDSSDDGSGDSSDSSSEKSDTFTAEKPSRFISQLSSEDDGLDKEEVDEISLTLHHPLDKNSEEENLAAGFADIDLNRTFIFGQCDDGNLMDLEQTLDDQPPSIHASAVANSSEIKRKTADALNSLYPVKGDSEAYKLSQQQRVLVSAEKLKELKGSKCNHALGNGSMCLGILSFTIDLKGTVAHVRWSCPNKHHGKWVSSEVIGKSHHQDIYLNDLLIGACVLLSGNNYSKFQLLCKFLNLAVPDRSVFCRNQRLFYLPVILTMWHDMRSKLLETLNPYKEIIIGGDGRNDSPGFSARFCVYVAMDLLTNLVIDMEILDKRETGGASTNMEREGLTRILLRLMKQINIGEIATDASSSIMKRVSELKANHPELENLAHSLDVWHMSKRLTKKLHNIVDNKEGKELKPWIESIVNHFWHCCETAKGDEKKLKDSWLGILHHICDEHEWADSQCDHGPLQSTEPKQFFSKDSAVMEKLRTVILDSKILSKLEYYTTFRHTGFIENFNSMLTKYAPKRCAFDYPYFKCRMALAGLDHNMHIYRPQATTKDGRACYKRKYCKATRKFRVEPVKEKKDFSYVPYCLAKIVAERQCRTDTVHERLTRVPGDPKLISKNLDLVVKPPSTSNLIQERKSRMETNK